MEKLIEILTMIKDECIKRPCNCNGCPFYDDVECMIENTPCMWDVENIERHLQEWRKRMAKGITLWLKYEDGHVERKWFSSSAKAVSWLENHKEVTIMGKVME